MGDAMRLGWWTVVALAAAASSCSSAGAPGEADASAPFGSASVGASPADPSASLGPPPRVELQESNGVELSAYRDPFVPGAPPTIVEPRRDHHMLDDRAIDELRLLGTVTGSRLPQAMVADPSGRGWVVEPGMRIGRAEVRGSSVAFWRVDRIGAGDVVLVREDGGESGLPSATRVLTLRRPG